MIRYRPMTAYRDAHRAQMSATSLNLQLRLVDPTNARPIQTEGVLYQCRDIVSGLDFTAQGEGIIKGNTKEISQEFLRLYLGNKSRERITPERATGLFRVLGVNPDNETALKLLDSLDIFLESYNTRDPLNPSSRFNVSNTYAVWDMIPGERFVSSGNNPEEAWEMFLNKIRDPTLANRDPIAYRMVRTAQIASTKNKSPSFVRGT